LDLTGLMGKDMSCTRKKKRGPRGQQEAEQRPQRRQLVAAEPGGLESSGVSAESAASGQAEQEQEEEEGEGGQQRQAVGKGMDCSRRCCVSWATQTWSTGSDCSRIPFVGQ